MGKPPAKKPKEQTESGFRTVAVLREQSFPSKVVEFVGSMGTREGGKQVRVKVLAGPDSGKIIRRNVLGPVRMGDILMLKETEIEASPLKGRKR